MYTPASAHALKDGSAKYGGVPYQSRSYVLWKENKMLASLCTGAHNFGCVAPPLVPTIANMAETMANEKAEKKILEEDKDVVDRVRRGQALHYARERVHTHTRRRSTFATVGHRRLSLSLLRSISAIKVQSWRNRDMVLDVPPNHPHTKSLTSSQSITFVRQILSSRELCYTGIIKA